MSRNTLRAVVIAATFAMVPMAFAQQGNGSQRNGMKDNNMGSVDMQGMMKKCNQMRQQMKTGAPMNGDMQKMMQQCDQMDRQGSNPPGGSDAPRTRTR